MTIEEALCKRRQELLQELAWVELLIPRARAKESAKIDALTNAAELFPRVLGISPQK